MASRLHGSTPWITASSSLAVPSVASSWRLAWHTKKKLGATDHGVELDAVDQGVELLSKTAEPSLPAPSLHALRSAPPPPARRALLLLPRRAARAARAPAARPAAPRTSPRHVPRLVAALVRAAGRLLIRVVGGSCRGPVRPPAGGQPPPTRGIF